MVLTLLFDNLSFGIGIYVMFRKHLTHTISFFCLFLHPLICHHDKIHVCFNMIHICFFRVCMYVCFWFCLHTCIVYVPHFFQKGVAGIGLTSLHSFVRLFNRMVEFICSSFRFKSCGSPIFVCSYTADYGCGYLSSICESFFSFSSSY